MVDIVEVNPLVDHGDVTSILAAKIGVEASGLYYAKRI
jgi:arginase family enzyme